MIDDRDCPLALKLLSVLLQMERMKMENSLDQIFQFLTE